MKKRKIILTIIIMFNIATFLLYYKYIVLTDPNEVTKYDIGLKIKKDNKATQKIEKESLNIYIPNETGEYLIEENMDIIKDMNKHKKVQAVFRYVKQNSNALISLETTLHNVYVSGDEVYLNLSREFGRYMDSPEKEQVIIYSVVNSVCAIEGVNKVKILIDNQNIRELGGYIDVSDYFESDLLLVK